MKNYCFKIVLLSCAVSLLSCYPRRTKNNTIQKYSERTGEAIAVDNLIQKYEREHLKLYQEEMKCGIYLKWPNLDKEDLSSYCRKYLQHSVPTRTTNNAIGTKIIRALHYEKENTNVTSKIVIVQCKVVRISPQPNNKTKALNIKARSYYITRAPESNCVYALKYTMKKALFTFNIIHKYCNFDNELTMDEQLKQKRVQITRILHKTGQPIAKNEYLLEYEVEHQQMLKKEGKAANMSEISPYGPSKVKKDDLQYFCFKLTKKDLYRLVESYEIMNDNGVLFLSSVSIEDVDMYFWHYSVRVRAATLDVKGIPGGVLAFQCAETAFKIVYTENILSKYRFYMYEMSRKSTATEPRIQLVKFVPKIVWTMKQKLREVLKLQDPKARFALANTEGVLSCESEFVYSQKLMDLFSRTSVCHITGFNMFELCAVAHNVWTHAPEDKAMAFLYEIRRPPPSITCKRNVRITVMTPGFNAITMIGFERYLSTDILPCAINTEWDVPSFYIARDQQFRTSAFIIENIDGKYYATMRIKTVHPLDY